jgi:tripartite-type tricarboxylate transporter receptor subunit TctC
MAPLRLFLIAWFAIDFAGPVLAQTAIADFYRGKTFTMIIGSTPGGGYDTYARLIARFMGPHIPGSPSVVVQNMPGASSNVAAAYMFNAAPKDGLEMAAVTPGAIMEPLLSDKVQVKIDASKFNYIGRATKDVYVCIVRKDAPIQRFEDVFSKEFIVGAVAEGGSTRDFPLLLRNVLGAKFRIINGYAGNREVTLALDKGELQGVCGNSYSGLKVIEAAWFQPDGLVRVLVQEDLKGSPELNAKGVPLAINFAKTDEQRQIISLLYEELSFARPYLMAPGVPAPRVEAIRAAFTATLQAPEFLAEAHRINVDITDPLSGEDLQKLIAKMYSAPADIVEKTRLALKE